MFFAKNSITKKISTDAQRASIFATKFYINLYSDDRWRAEVMRPKILPTMKFSPGLRQAVHDKQISLPLDEKQTPSGSAKLKRI